MEITVASSDMSTVARDRHDKTIKKNKGISNTNQDNNYLWTEWELGGCYWGEAWGGLTFCQS